MKFVIAPDSFKGSLSAEQAATAMERAIRSVYVDADIRVLPMADGGEGTMDVLVSTLSGKRVNVGVHGLRREWTTAEYGILDSGRTAIIEVAKVVGLASVNEADRNPLEFSTFGVGELMKHAIQHGATKVIVGLGGSATNDGGAGMLHGLGVRFSTADQQSVAPIPRCLPQIVNVSFDSVWPLIEGVEIVIASDVDNPLCGPHGCSAVYGPQKGATRTDIEFLDASLSRYADEMERILGVSQKDEPGAGAAGGLGYALMALGGTFVSGASLVAEQLGLERDVANANWVLTGEGRTDRQTSHGKVPYYVASLAAKHHVPCILISGSLSDGVEEMENVYHSMHSILDAPMTVQDAMANAESLLYRKTRNLVKLLQSRHYTPRQ